MFFLVLKMGLILIILSLVVVEGFHLEQLDVKKNLSPCGFGRRYLYVAAIGVWGQSEGEFGL